MLPPNDAPPHWSVDFWVHDVDATAQRATELGGRVVVAPYEPLPDFKQAVLADPAGAAFSVTKVGPA
jgi:predicted enzyme related to lactoylglutathione lyase